MSRIRPFGVVPGEQRIHRNNAALGRGLNEEAPASWLAEAVAARYPALAAVLFTLCGATHAAQKPEPLPSAPIVRDVDEVSHTPTAAH